jgi:hypothetical protein
LGVVAVLVLAGCEGTVKFQPAGLSVEFSVDSKERTSSGASGPVASRQGTAANVWTFELRRWAIMAWRSSFRVMAGRTSDGA